MENLLIISHDVADATTWKPGFDSQEGLRNEAGIKTLGVYTAEGNPNRITVVTQVSDVAKAKEFLNNPALAEAMKDAGVTSAPEINFLGQLN